MLGQGLSHHLYRSHDVLCSQAGAQPAPSTGEEATTKRTGPFSWASPAHTSGQLHFRFCFLFLSFLKTNKQNQQQQTKKQSLCIHSVHECTAVMYILTCLKVQVFSWDKSKWFFPCRVWLSLKLLPNPGSEVPSELQEAGALGKTPSQMALQMLQLSSSKS